MDVIVPSRPYLKHPLVQAMRRSDLKQNDDLIPCAWHKVVKYKEMKLRMENESNTKRRRRTQEGNNNNAQYSLREGPKRRPYTAAQLAEMLSVFHRLLLKFSGDSVFVSVISSYIEAVSSTLPVDG